VLNNLFTPPERRAITFQKLFEIGDPSLTGGTRSGVNITQDNAIRITPVFAAVRLIADSISTLPVDAFYRAGSERRALRPKPVWIDNPEPDRNVSRVDHYQMMIFSLLVHGESFTRKLFNQRGDVIALHIMDPRRIKVRRDADGRIEYVVDQGKTVLTEDEIVHITDLRLPGALHGTSRIAELKETLGIAKALEEYSAAFFGSGSSAAGVIEIPGEITAEQAKAIQDGWEKGHKGLRKAHRPGVLSGGAKFNSTTIAPNDSQLIEEQQFVVEQVARMFRIPVHMLQSTQQGAMSYASVEESSRQFVTYTLLPMIQKIENAYSMMLIGDAFLKFNVDGLLRANLQDRYTAYSQAIQGGWLSINDIHRLEDLDRVDGGDQYRVALANVNLGAANIVELEKRVDMVARLVQVGYSPSAAAEAVGLPAIDHTGLPSVQLQNATQAAESPANIQDAYNARGMEPGEFAEVIRSTIDAIPTPVVNVTLPDGKTRKIERDADGNISRIVEE
jgi:HK97 family phage portal protein